MTIEVWMKQSLKSDKGIILETSELNSISRIQISSTGSSSIVCNPDAGSLFDKSVPTNNLKLLNVWIHYSCISNSVDKQLTNIVYYRVSEISNSIGNSYFDQT
jgi:hypothetical protein